MGGGRGGFYSIAGVSILSVLYKKSYSYSDRLLIVHEMNSKQHPFKWARYMIHAVTVTVTVKVRDGDTIHHALFLRLRLRFRSRFRFTVTVRFTVTDTLRLGYRFTVRV